MKQEDKDLLLQDLSGRLLYGIKVSVNQLQLQNYDCKWKNWGLEEEPEEVDGVSIYGVTFGCMDMSDGVIGFEFIKPYLFPLSSMTEEQKKEFKEISKCEYEIKDYGGFDSEGVYLIEIGRYEYEHDIGTAIEEFYFNHEIINWLNKNHFDYRGLIEKGLALDATGLNIY